MKKPILLLVVMLCFVMPTVWAKEDTQKSVVATWEISMMPKATPEEKERNRWTLILENDLGLYAYAKDTLGFGVTGQNKLQRHLVESDIKTVFLDKELIEKLNARYSDKLQKKDSFSYTIIHMVFNIKAHTFASTRLQAFSEKGKELENTVKKAKFVPVPPKSFAEAMLEISKSYAAAQENAAKERAAQKK